MSFFTQPLPRNKQIFMKKHTYTLTFLLFLSFNLFAQEGIKFLEAELGEVLALAELEGKLVFVDAYTDWCKHVSYTHLTLPTKA